MRADRFLSILIIISQKGLVTAKELADHFEVSLRTIYRDIEKICEAGVPIGAIGGKGGGYYIMEKYNINNLFFNKKEIEPLLSLMDSLKCIFGNSKQFNDIVLKFETLYKREHKEYDKLNIDMSHFSMEQELREYLLLVNRAIENDRILELEYINRKMEYSQRIVEPIQIEFTDGQWYIIGFCRIRKDYRRFKFVRIRNMNLGESFVKRNISQDEIEKIFKESYKKNSILVTLKFSDEIGKQLSEYFSKDKIRHLDNGTYMVEGIFPDDEGLKKFILGFGVHCEVIAPTKLRKEMLEYIKNIYCKYND
jgi:predicted DNA-binding transcriptional regulator YafY